MIASILRFSIRFRAVVLVLAVLGLAYGIYRLPQTRLNVFPEFAPPLAVVQTEAPGLSAEQTEKLVTQPIENALNGLIGLRSMRSRSIQGLSVITLTFRNGTPIERARQLVAEQLTMAATHLPLGVQPPRLTPLTSSTSVVLVTGLSSTVLTPMQLRTLADWTVRPALMSVPGVADVSVFGGGIRQLQIQADPQRLVRYGLSLQDVLQAARRATGVRGAGFIENRNQRIVLHTQGQTTTAAQLRQVVLAYHHGVGIALGDVAQVVDAPAPAIGGATIDGMPGVVLDIDEQYGADTLKVTHAIDRALQQLQPLLRSQHVTLHASLFRPASFIDTAIHHLRTALLLGTALVIAVLFLFLFNVRTAVISVLAIPFSLLAAVVVLQHFGIGLNTMTLGGLAIALGEVVDDAIVDVENIFRRLRENHDRPQPLPAARVIYAASFEVRGAVVYATFIVALVFLPVLMLSGVAGRLFAPLGIAYISAILASLAVALTITPALASVLLTRTTLSSEDPPLMRWLKKNYAPFLRRSLNWTRTTLAIVLLGITAALLSVPFFGMQFLPPLREGHYILHVASAPGTSLAESLRLGRQLSLALEKIPGVRSIAQRVGRAEQSSDTFDVNAGEFEVDLTPGLSGAEQARVLDAIRQVLRQFPGINSSVETFLAERIEETISGHTAQVVVNVFGNRLDALNTTARAVAQVLRQVPGAVDVQVQSPPTAPQLAIRLRQASLARWGFAPVDVLDTIRTAYAGSVVAQTYQGNRVFDVTVLLSLKERQNPLQIGGLPLRNPDGVMVPLRELAAIHERSEPSLIAHDDGKRVQTVTANVKGRALSAFVQDARRQVAADVTLSHGVYTVFTGAAEAQARAQRELLVHAVLAGVGIALLLYMALRSARLLWIVMFNLPFALAGGVLAGWITGGVLSLGALVGFVTLFGITLRNSLMLMSRYRDLVMLEGIAWGPEAALRGAIERLAPILMTALVTALGLLPLALTSGAPGNEIEGPMATVILGGLLTSTILNLLVLPSLALRYARFEPSAMMKDGAF